eukprot:2511748-Ditylum_brightwellii.AAC.1
MDLVAREVDSDKLRDAIINVYNGTCSERTHTLNTRRAQSEESQTYQIYQWATAYANAEMPNNAYTYKEM